MNILRSTLERRFSLFSFRSTSCSDTFTVYSAKKNELVETFYRLPVHYQNHETAERIFCSNLTLQKIHWQFPSKQKMVITFPSANRRSICLPGLLVNELLRKFDPLPAFQVSLRLPQQSPIVELFAGERMLKIRRHKMRKHKRRKRYDRDYFKYQKYHRQKKAKAESLFRSRMSKMLEEYKAFDPEKYIKNIITCAKKDVTKDVSPSGRRKYPHWSTLVTLEELYGLPPTSYIDKKAGLAEAEERDKIRQLKKEYDQKYRGFLFRRNDSYSGPKQVSVLEERQEISNETVVQEKRRDDCSTDSEKTTVKADSPDDVIDSKSS